MKEFDAELFWDILQELRRDKGYSQAQLGERLHVQQHTISSYERGVCLPNIRMLYDMAKLFQVSADYLLGLNRKRQDGPPRPIQKRNTRGFSSE